MSTPFKKLSFGALAAGLAAGAALLIPGWPRVEPAATERLDLRGEGSTRIADAAALSTEGNAVSQEQVSASAVNADPAATAVELARTDPVAALNVALEVRPGRDRDEMLRHAASQWAAADAVAATDWATAVEDLPLQRALLESVVTVWAASDPRAAAEFVATKMRGGGNDVRAIAAVVNQWARRDPQAAAQWVEEFPPGPERDAAHAALLDSWTALDAAAAAKWAHDSLRHDPRR